MKSIYATLLIIASGISGSAMADNLHETGDTVTRSVDLVFAEKVKVDFKLIPERNLKAGNTLSNTKVASLKITATPASRIGVRFTPNTGERMNAGQYRLGGKNDPHHKISLYMPPLPGAIYVAKGDWIVSKDKAAIDWEIKTHSEQNIAADTYTLSMDAVAFIS
ncbi:hypothetical protein [Pantoea sp. ME81]|uniref:hypothetical protein n=1 Tax=Pantoea sp. ME81 TaxID=2743935 RepID=UPI0015F37E12|nr:hypothetical protein [Pantoea sp. ME81]